MRSISYEIVLLVFQLNIRTNPFLQIKKIFSKEYCSSYLFVQPVGARLYNFNIHFPVRRAAVPRLEIVGQASMPYACLT